ncbi:GH22265 [Drosophila grimshawi]|uniref:GH22265 n=1 Tax=Drosophila grimshawi TaxID=7222 RepID=B4K1Y6_DROGR|nr:GH22265 [Drosophila grimshawi]
MEEKFCERLGQVKEEFAKELQLSTQEMVETHRKDMEIQKAKLQSEKEEALQELVERHRAKMAAAEERINDVELRHQRHLKDLKAAYDAEKAALDKRDISNANEIEQLHRKCRCLTNLFEEMRMRYERRDPRAEDLREISELRTRCDSQERDLFVLTDRLREMQIQMSELQQNGDGAPRNKTVKKPPPKAIATSCDVIYEENEERESPEHGSSSASSSQDDTEEDAEEGEQGEQEPSDTESNHTIEVNGKCNKDRINEDDAHMISTVSSSSSSKQKEKQQEKKEKQQQQHQQLELQKSNVSAVTFISLLPLMPIRISCCYCKCFAVPPSTLPNALRLPISLFLSPNLQLFASFSLSTLSHSLYCARSILESGAFKDIPNPFY